MRKKKISVLLGVILVVSISGCKHEHTFTEATCTKPKICTECGERSGKVLGHTCEFGLCKRCNELQNYDLVTEIDSKLKEAENTTNIALYLISGGIDETSIYSNICEGLQYYKEAKTLYEEIYALCGDYKELSTVKEDIEDVCVKLPLSIESGSTQEAILFYMNDLEVFVTAQAKCKLSMLYVMDLYSE